MYHVKYSKHLVFSRNCAIYKIVVLVKYSDNITGGLQVNEAPTIYCTLRDGMRRRRGGRRRRKPLGLTPQLVSGTLSSSLVELLQDSGSLSCLLATPPVDTQSQPETR